MKKTSKKTGTHKKVKAEKKKKSTGGFPKQVAVIMHRDENDADQKYLTIHPIDFSDINADTTVAIFGLRRIVNVNVVRKIKRIPK